NYIDEAYKGAMHGTANLMGEIGWNKAERALLEGTQKSPSRAAKGATFKLLISANALRQGLIQRGQLGALLVANPRYSVSRLIPDMLGVRRAKMGWTKEQKYLDLYDEIKD